MKRDYDSLQAVISTLPPEVQIRTKLSIAIARRIEHLMVEAHLNKKQFAEALGRRPSEVTKWLSGEHNFTVATLAMIGTYFHKPIIEVGEEDANEDVDANSKENATEAHICTDEVSRITD